MATNPNELQSLLHGFEFGTLSPEEEDVLMAAALKDSAIFDSLWQATRNRDFLNEGAERQRLAALCLTPAKKPFFAGVRPYVWVSGALALGLIVLFSWKAILPTRPDYEINSGANVSTAVANTLFDAPLANADPGAVRPVEPRPAGLPSSQVQFTLALPPDTALLVLRRFPGKDAELLWPSMLRQSPIPKPSDTKLTFDLRNPANPQPAERVEFRFLLAPRHVDLRVQPESLHSPNSGITSVSFSFPLEP